MSIETHTWNGKVTAIFQAENSWTYELWSASHLVLSNTSRLFSFLSFQSKWRFKNAKLTTKK